MMESVIRLENFYFAYNKSELVLQDIDLEIKKGSFTVVAGPVSYTHLDVYKRQFTYNSGTRKQG